MANYMEQVANMLGVEIGEEFELGNGYIYQFTEEGIICPEYSDDEGDYAEILRCLLRGSSTIIHKPWKPKVDDKFWHIEPDGSYCEDIWGSDDGYCLNYYKLGNCYRTEAAAEKDYDKWTAFYASDEVLEV